MKNLFTTFAFTLFILAFFNTPIVAQYTYTQSFDSTAFPPTGWTATIIDGTLNWVRFTTTQYPSGFNPHSGAGMAGYNCYNQYPPGHALLVSPVFSLQGRGSSPDSVVFWLFRGNVYSGAYDSLTVWINTASNLTGATLLGSTLVYNGSNTWVRFAYNVPASFTGTTNYVLFEAVSAWYNDVYVDDILLTEYPLTAPSPPTLISPANNSTGLPTTDTLVWNASSGATSYRVQLATDSLFTTLIVNDSTVTTTSKIVSGLSYNTKYYWHVNAKNVVGTSSYSPTWNFTTTAPTPQYFNLNTGASSNSFPFSVTAGKEVQSLILANEFNQPTSLRANKQITTVWFRMGGTASNITFTNLTIKMGQSTITTLPTGVIYTGQMDTVYHRGSVSLSSTTGQWMSITLDRPFGYDTTRSLIIDVIQCGASAIGMTVFNSSLSGIRRTYVNENSCVPAYSGQDGSMVNCGVDVATLVIPAAPTLIAPINGALLTTLTPTLDWSSVASATNYRVQVCIDSTFGSPQIDTVVSYDSMLVPAGKLSNGAIYYWRVRGVNGGVGGNYSVIWHFSTPVGITNNNEQIPKEFMLYHNYPNPFNPLTKIKYDLPKSTFVKIVIYDVLGQLIEVLVNDKKNAGRYEIDWDGSKYASGTYFYKMETDSYTDIKKMVLIK